MSSVYNDDADKIVPKLDSVSSSFCLAKWYYQNLHLTTGHTSSCYHPPTHSIPVDKLAEDPSVLHNTPQKIEERLAMMAGKRPSGCSYCWRMEDSGHRSDRHYRSGEAWAAQGFDEARNNLSVTPTYVEVDFSNVCNLKCAYCSPQYSSSWMADADKHGAFPTLEPHNDPSFFTGSRRPIPHREANPYVDAFWKWWPDLYPKLKHFRMTGGEPLMDKNTWRVFDHVLENPKPDLHLNVTSNFSVEPALFNKYMDYAQRLCEGEKIEHLMQFVSVDSWGAQAEYVRDGLDFNRLWDNVNTFLEKIPGRNSVTFIITMNNLSITGLRELMTGIYGLRSVYTDTYERVWFDVPVLRDPAWMSIQLLPESYAYQLEKIRNYISGDPAESCDNMSGFRDYEVAKFDRDIEWMRQPMPEDERRKQMVNWFRFYTAWDERRNKNFLTTFPEMEDWWSECEYWSKRYDG